jgi:hypothetical protein
MDGISRSPGLNEWSHDSDFLRVRTLDETYRKNLRLGLHINTGSNYNAGASARASWKSYRFELVQIFSEQVPSWRPVGYFQDLSESYTSCFNSVHYIKDLVRLCPQAHPALLEAHQNKVHR